MVAAWEADRLLRVRQPNDDARLTVRDANYDRRQKERREREKTEVLARFRAFAQRSHWRKTRIARELGVSLSTVDRWLCGHDKILLASMLDIRRFLGEWD